MSDAECIRGLRCAHRLGDILGEERTGVCEHGKIIRSGAKVPKINALHLF